MTKGRVMYMILFILLIVFTWAAVSLFIEAISRESCYYVYMGSEWLPVCQ